MHKIMIEEIKLVFKNTWKTKIAIITLNNQTCFKILRHIGKSPFDYLLVAKKC